METEEIITKAIQCAYNVHLEMPPGFYERIYQRALLIELESQGLTVQSEVWLDAKYKGRTIGKFRVDLIVENEVLIELKAVDTISPLNGVQLVNYLNMTGLDNGLLINFGSAKIQIERKYRLRNK